MEIRLKDRSKFIAAAASSALALLLSARWFVASESPTSAALRDRVADPTPTAFHISTTKANRIDFIDPTLRYSRLEQIENKHYEGSGRNIFVAYVDGQPKRVHSEPEAGPQLHSDQSPIPTIRLKFFGVATMNNFPRKVCLSQDGDVFIGGEGDILDRRYKILRIDSNSADVEDLIANNTYTLALEQ